MNATYSAIRIVLADDHEIFRDGFNGLLAKQDEIKLVGEASNGKELLQVTEKLLPDIVLTDIRMPVMDGIEATRIITKQFPQVYVIALSMFNDDHLVMDMMEAGARGYLLKNAHKTEILEAIRSVHKEEIYYCRQTSAKLIQLLANSKYNSNKKKLAETFNEKELEVIRLICQEYSSKEMSDKLNCSVRTVEGYRKKIQDKMKVRNSTGIAVYAIRNNIYKI